MTPQERREQNDTRYWLTDKGWAAVRALEAADQDGDE